MICRTLPFTRVKVDIGGENPTGHEYRPFLQSFSICPKKNLRLSAFCFRLWDNDKRI